MRYKRTRVRQIRDRDKMRYKRKTDISEIIIYEIIRERQIKDRG